MQLRYDGRWAVRSQEMEQGVFIHLDIKEQMQALLHKLLNTKMRCGVYEATEYWDGCFYEMHFEMIDESWAKIAYEDLILGAFRLHFLGKSLDQQASREIEHCDFKYCKSKESKYSPDDCVIMGCLYFINK